MEVKIEESWKAYLQEEFKRDYFFSLVQFLKNEKAQKKIIYPQGKDIFNAFNLCPFQKIKVVILGQDPYHGHGQAHGLSFSVPQGISIPPSLKNIYKELHSDVPFTIPHHGNLSSWAQQGVFLLNASLTVEAQKPMSHAQIGWEKFTDAVISILNNNKENLVFLLWGKFAQQKIEFIDTEKHLVLKAAHPSPFSAYNGFFGCKHFSQCNQFLISKNIDAISWQI